MVFYIKNKMVSWGDGSYVLDENGQKAYQVKGRVFSVTRKKFIYDLQGNLLFSVRNKYWTFFRKSVYIYDHRGGTKQLLCRVKAPFFSNWKVVENNIDLELKGRFLDGIYAKLKGYDIGKFYLDRSFAAVFIRDAYTLEVVDPMYAEFLIALVVAYDNIRDQHKD